jgi:hypothetical protein
LYTALKCLTHSTPTIVFIPPRLDHNWESNAPRCGYEYTQRESRADEREEKLKISFNEKEKNKNKTERAKKLKALNYVIKWENFRMHACNWQFLLRWSCTWGRSNVNAHIKKRDHKNFPRSLTSPCLTDAALHKTLQLIHISPRKIGIFELSCLGVLLIDDKIFKLVSRNVAKSMHVCSFRIKFYT